MESKTLFDELKCCVIIPTYNNQKTIKKVVDEVLEYTTNVIIVNDGSTDDTSNILSEYDKNIKIIHHEVNKGKGIALRNAFKIGVEMGFTHAVTIDSDGQHFPSDLPKFLNELKKQEEVLIIGSRNMEQDGIPAKSSFGNKFSNFWFWFETGIKLEDTQSGYRLYPIKTLYSTRWFTNRFEFEIEVIVKSAWKGVKIKNIPIQIHYDLGSERISHFRPFTDFTRISLLNTYLVILALCYYIPKRFIQNLTWTNIKKFFRQNLFNPYEPTSIKVFSIGFGVFMGIFPIWGYQMIVGVALAHLMKLNKALFLVAANISIPPFMPLIIYGSYKVGGWVVENPKNDILFRSGFNFEMIKDNLVQYITGSIILAALAGALATILSYLLITVYKIFDKSVSLND